MKKRRFDQRIGSCFLPATTLLLVVSALPAQSVPPRLRGGAQPQTSAPVNTPSPGTPAPTTPIAPTPTIAPQAVGQPVSLLQQPPEPAKVMLSAAKLSIHADNSSLSAILHEISKQSGMKIEGLGGDERVFGTFGPGAPRDVIADLLNGTSYNVVLLGDLGNGAPRQLILTAASHSGGAAPVQAAPANADDAEGTPEAAEPDPPAQPDQPINPQQPPGSVRTPQQLFEQLQRMRQNQAQQPPDQQQQQQPQ